MGWGLLVGKLKQTAQGAVLSLQRRVDNTVPLLYPVCVGRSHVFRKRPQGVAQTLSAAKRGGAERLCDGCPCVGAEEICGVPSPNLCRSVDDTTPSACPLRARLPPNPAQKNIKHLTYEAMPNSATVNKLCFQPAQAHPRIRYRRIRHSEPQAPLHAHHAERKTKTYVFEVD